MAEMSRILSSGTPPQILLVPETEHDDPGLWAGRWAVKREDCRRVDLGVWGAPLRNTWVNKLNLAIYRANRPVVLVAHGLGCVTVAWWAEYEQPAFGDPVIGALLMAPPDVDRPGLDPRLARLGSCPRKELPFPSYLVASRNDPRCSYRTALSLARDWGSHFAYVDEIGQFDGHGGLSEWDEGERLLARLLADPAHPRRPEPPAPAARPVPSYPGQAPSGARSR